MGMLTKFSNNEDGATVIEYGLIAALIALGILGAMTSAFTALGGIFETVATAVSNAL